MIKELPRKGGTFRYNSDGTLVETTPDAPAFPATPCESKMDLKGVANAHKEVKHG